MNILDANIDREIGIHEAKTRRYSELCAEIQVLGNLVAGVYDTEIINRLCGKDAFIYINKAESKELLKTRKLDRKNFEISMDNFKVRAYVDQLRSERTKIWD